MTHKLPTREINLTQEKRPDYSGTAVNCEHTTGSYKQNVFLSYLSYIMLSMYKANKGVVLSCLVLQYLLPDPYLGGEVCWWCLIVRCGLLWLFPLRLYVRLLKVLSRKQTMKKLIKAHKTITIFIQLLKQESQLLK